MTNFAPSTRASQPLRADLKEIRRNLGLSRERMARLLDVSTKTIERWEDRDVPPKNRVAVERLLKLQEMIDLGLQIYTLDAFRAFMSLPIPVFQGRTAFQLIEMGDIDVVYGEIVADYEGGGY